MIFVFLQGQTPLDVCDGETFELLKELKAKQPPIKNEPIETVKRILPTRPIDEQKSILRSELHNENLDKVNKPSQVDENSANGAPNLKVRSSYFHIKQNIRGTFHSRKN